MKSADGRRRVALSAYLDPEGVETAEREANRWIKELRHARIGQQPFRSAFRYRGDSLWWFAELYLHKRRRIVSLFRRILALESLIRQERPRQLTLIEGDWLTQGVAAQVAERCQISFRGPRGWKSGPIRRDRRQTAVSGAFYAWSARLRRLRQRPAPQHDGPVALVAFVHSAFWREEEEDETYVGPVLRELGRRLSPRAFRLVGVGPSSNFRARGWRQRLAELVGSEPALPGGHDEDRMRSVPIEAYAPPRSLGSSLELWRGRRRIFRALIASENLRNAAFIKGCDAWPVVREELRGVSHLQFPWSARAMDEAAATLEALKPNAVVTYAEAGGWGRAIVLEARRRNIPVAGLQHGFIYRHWLNYLHEPDELRPAPGDAGDRGFPHPDLTLVYDDLAARHLVQDGRLPPESIVVSGSPRLDELAAAVRRLTASDLERIRTAVGAAPDAHIALLATKYRQIDSAFGALLQAVASMPDVHLVVKCHPAESAAPYDRAARGMSHVTIAPGSANLAELLAVSRVIITVNSTVALDAMVLGVPALVVALPNNLSPFVDAGAMAGVTSIGEIGSALRAILYDEAHRARLARASRDVLLQFSICADGRAASRAADAIFALAQPSQVPLKAAVQVQDGDRRI